MDSPFPCVVFSHESIERGRSGIDNRAEIRALFAEANARRPGTVRLAINGHEHKDYFRMRMDLGKSLECCHCRNRRISREIDDLNNHFLGISDEDSGVLYF